MMEIAFMAGLIIVGLVALSYGGDWVVDGGVGLAKALGVTPLVIGVVFLGFATSLPELFTSVQAVLRDKPGVALGNVVGSNIANLLLIAGVASALAATRVRRTMVWRDGSFVLGTSAILAGLIYYGHVSREAGLALVVILVVYLITALLTERHRQLRRVEKDRRQRAGAKAERPDAAAADGVKTEYTVTRPMDDPLKGEEEAEEDIGLAIAIRLFLLGVVVTIAGAAVLVEGAARAARQFGASEALIGLTIVAFGTSLPELAATIAAGLRKQAELAIGNVLGSNVFNVCAVVGVSALIKPFDAPVELQGFDVIAMLTATLLMLGLALRGRQLSRFEGMVLLCGYVTFITLTIYLKGLDYFAGAAG